MKRKRTLWFNGHPNQPMGTPWSEHPQWILEIHTDGHGNLRRLLATRSELNMSDITWRRGDDGIFIFGCASLECDTVNGAQNR